MAWVLILAVNSQTVWILVCVRDITGNQLPKDPTEPPAVVWWSTSFVSLAWGLCSQTLLLFLVPAFCPFTDSEWFCTGLILLTQNRNTTLPSTFYQDSLEGRSVPRSHAKHTDSHNGLGVTQWLKRQELLEWQLSHCAATALAEELLPSWSLQAGSNNWLQRIKWTQNFLQ